MWTSVYQPNSSKSDAVCKARNGPTEVRKLLPVSGATEAKSQGRPGFLFASSRLCAFALRVAGVVLGRRTDIQRKDAKPQGRKESSAGFQVQGTRRTTLTRAGPLWRAPAGSQGRRCRGPLPWRARKSPPVCASLAPCAATPAHFRMTTCAAMPGRIGVSDRGRLRIVDSVIRARPPGPHRD